MAQTTAFFHEYDGDSTASRYGSALLLAAISIGGLLAVSVHLGLSAPAFKVAEEGLDVTFVDKVAPPPPPPPVVKSLPRSLEPIPENVPAHIQKVVVKELPKPKMIKVPLTIKKSNLAEGDPSQNRVYVLEGAGTGSVDAGLPVASADAVAERPTLLPPKARAPEPYSGNASPAYPAEAKATGLEDTVILRIVVSTTGHVTVKDVIRGNEPFVSAAIEAVKSWKYSPAIKDGKPISVFHIVKIPFKMRA